MDKCKGKHKGLTGILSSVSKECFYISHEKMVVATYQPSSSAQLIDRTIGSVITVETKLTEERIARDSGRQTPVMVKSNNPVDRSMKEVEWVRVVVVRRILRATSVLALLLPPPPIGCTAKLKAVEGASGERDSVALEEGMGRICLLHGSKQMPFTTNAL